MDGRMGGWVGGLMEGWMDGWMDGWAVSPVHTALLMFVSVLAFGTHISPVLSLTVSHYVLM